MHLSLDAFYMDIDKLLLQLKNKHNNKYDYTLVSNVSSQLNKIKIICPEHGVFLQTIKDHKKGNGCTLCGIKQRSIKKVEKAKSDFVRKSNIIHNDFYSYDKSDYKSAKTLIKVKCPLHGEFEISPNKHLNGRGCQKCGFDRRNELRRKNINDFIIQANIIHHNKYDYSKVEYKNTDTKVKIICPIHGIFEQSPSKHLNYNGCNSCNKTGFNHNRQSFFYIHKIMADDIIKSYKFGITNTNPKSRLHRQNYMSLFKIVDFFSIQLIGNDAYNLEKYIKENIQSTYLIKEEMKDGYTETIDPKDIDKLEEIIIEYLTNEK